jgi:hypothetical protein
MNKLTGTISIFILTILSLNTQAQQRNYISPLGAGVDIVGSGNAHGAFLAPYLQLNIRRNSFVFSPLIQMRTKEMTGGKISYSRNLSARSAGDLDLFQINIFAYVQHTQNLLLSENTVRDENKMRQKENVQWDKVRYTTSEGGAGIELRINLTSSVCIKNFVGFSVYDHQEYIKVMDHEKTATSLMLGTGIYFTPF